MTHPTGTRSDDDDALLTPHASIWVRWFVQYNPLFSLSALCVLGGVLLTQKALGAGSELMLFGIVEVYQWVLIGTAALLYRRLHEHRPGVILGMIALVFMIDPTLSLSGVVSYAADHDQAAVAAFGAAFFVAAVAAKLAALRWAFCLEASMSAKLLPVLLAVVVAALPSSRVFGDVADGALLSIGLFVLGATAVLWPPTMRSTRALGRVGHMMFPRLMHGAAAIAVVGGVLQGQNAVLAMGYRATFAIVGTVVFIAVMQLARVSEQLVWVGLAIGLWLMAASGLAPEVFLPIAVVTMMVAARHHPPRVVVGALTLLALPFATVGSGVIAVDIVVVVATSVVFVVMLKTLRAWSALPALGALSAKFVVTVMAPAAAAQGTSTWGASLLVAGFVFIPLGVIAHRRLSAMVGGDPDGDDAGIDDGVDDQLASLSTTSAAAPSL